MLSPYYRIYLHRVLNLAKTMVIKSEVTADTINKELVLIGHYVDYSNPQTWKYYMNLAGLYYQTDQPMSVVSLDTLETIQFTKENLAIHKATATAYVFGTRYYNDLLRRYPTQECLILGIINPVNIQTAINATDGTILYYDPELVEEQEYSLISKLQQWVYAFVNRWNVSGYSMTDEYYAAAQLGILFANLPLEIMNCRLEACLTSEAHSFHIKEYLASHGRLDKFIPQMTLKQALFLYRNIRYIRRHAGTQKTFNLLLEKIITDRNLPLAQYEIHHDVSGMPTSLYPEVELRRIPVNNIASDGSYDTHSIDDLQRKQFDIARGNQANIELYTNDTINKIINSPVNQLPTKVYESAVLDTTDCVPFTLEDTLLHHWIYLAATDRYTTMILVSNPYDGTKIALNPKEAFVLFMYALNKAYGLTLDEIPSIVARRVRKVALPNVFDLRALVDTSIVSDEWLVALLEDQPAIGVYITVDSFVSTCRDIQAVQNKQYLLYAQQERRMARSMLESATSSMYQTVLCDLYPGENYTQWLGSRFIDIEQLSVGELETLATNILNAIGANDYLNENSLRDMQKSMLDLMATLSSYSVQYLQDINDGSYKILDTVNPRFEMVSYTVMAERFVKAGGIDIFNTKIKIRDAHTERSDGIDLMNQSFDYGVEVIPISAPVDTMYVFNENTTIHIGLGIFNLTVSE